MTINEAIEELENTKNYPISEPASDEALDMAIAALHIEQLIFNTGYKNGIVKINLRGRCFVVREVAQ